MGTPIDVFNLLPAEQDHSEVSQKMIKDHEAALKAVTAGKWDNATKLLTRLPNADGPRHFLIRQMELYRNPPRQTGMAYSLSPTNSSSVFEFDFARCAVAALTIVRSPYFRVVENDGHLWVAIAYSRALGGLNPQLL